MSEWVRDSIETPVMRVPGIPAVVSVEATASAAPTSVSYWLPPVQGIANSATGLQAVVSTSDNTLSGHVLGVMAAAWAVDNVSAAYVGDDVRLAIKLAVIGPSRIMRVGYSAFAKVKVQTGGPGDGPHRPDF
jgi:hypothetical protein